jgi:hypothetical protein
LHAADGGATNRLGSGVGVRLVPPRPSRTALSTWEMGVRRLPCSVERGRPDAHRQVSERNGDGRERKRKNGRGLALSAERPHSRGSARQSEGGCGGPTLTNLYDSGFDTGRSAAPPPIRRTGPVDACVPYASTTLVSPAELTIPDRAHTGLHSAGRRG